MQMTEKKQNLRPSRHVALPRWLVIYKISFSGPFDITDMFLKMQLKYQSCSLYFVSTMTHPLDANYIDIFFLQPIQHYSDIVFFKINQMASYIVIFFPSPFNITQTCFLTCTWDQDICKTCVRKSLSRRIYFNSLFIVKGIQ